MPFPSEPDSNHALNRVLVVLHRSLAAYLSYADPWVAYGNEESRRIFDSIVADKKERVAHLTTLLHARRHPIDFGEFPMDFTSLHDVSLDFLLKGLVEHQRRDVQTIEGCLGRLAGDAEGRALGEEVLANARRHLQSLEALARQPVNKEASGAT